MDFDRLKKFIDEQDIKLDKLYNNFDNDQQKKNLAYAVKLTEEVGELSDEILAYNSFQRQEKLYVKGKDDLGDEFADVMLVLLLLMKNMDIDMEKVLNKKMAKLEKRK